MASSQVPSAEGSPTLKSVQVLRALAAICVVVVHSGSEKVTLLGGEGWPGKNFLLGAASVDLFFIISGFVMVYSSESMFGRPEGPRRFYLRRLLRVVPLYWTFTTALILYIYAAHGAKLWEIYSPMSLIASFLFWPYPRLDGLAFPVHLLGWTLIYEMFFYTLFAVGVWLPRRAVVAVMCVGFTALVVYGRYHALPLPFSYWANLIIIDFCYGMIIALIYREGFRLSPAAAWALGIAACVGYAAAAVPEGEWRILFWGLPGSALFAACVLSTKTWHPGPVGRFFALLGDASYSLYLLHPLIFPVVRWTVGPFFIGTNLGWLYSLIGCVAAVGASIVCYLVYEHPITRTLQRRLRDAEKSRVAWRSAPAE